MYQQIVLAGHLGADPELRHTGGHIPFCSFPVAVHKRRPGDGEGTPTTDETTWFRVTAWRR
jgi:single-stranded DNA-binding protein